MFSKYEQVKTEASYISGGLKYIFGFGCETCCRTMERLKVPSGWKRFGKGELGPYGKDLPVRLIGVEFACVFFMYLYL